MKITIRILIILGILLALFTFYNFSNFGKIKPLNNQNKESVLNQKILETKINTDGEVTIKVAPKGLTSDSLSWDFEIILDTHSLDLNEDLTEVSVLIDTNGNEYAPVSWEGDPPGGHHREGVLKFKPITPLPQSITLKIRNVGSVNERSFSWQIP